MFLVLTFQCFAGPAQNKSNAFALSLFSHLEKGEENVAFSPYGLFNNLLLLSYGAYKGTKKELRHTLGLSVNDKSCAHLYARDYPLNMTTGLFAHQGTAFTPAFENIAQDLFDAELHTVNYTMGSEAVSTINGWIANQTGGKISGLIEESDIDSATRLILANTVYFEKGWISPFMPQNTHHDPFYPEQGSPIQVEMMRQSKEFLYFEDGQTQGVYLPFARGTKDTSSVECLLLLPSDKSSLEELEKSLSEKTLAQWKESRALTPMQVQVPKFSFSKKVTLDPALKDMGITSAFSSGANFKGMSTDQKLYLQTCLQETFFSFHEKGVTAAAATTSHMGLTAMPPQVCPEASFIAERPFLFLLVSAEDDTILFMGRVASPQEALPGDAIADGI